jgi:hypothetical protein
LRILPGHQVNAQKKGFILMPKVVKKQVLKHLYKMQGHEGHGVLVHQKWIYKHKEWKKSCDAHNNVLPVPP